MKVKTAQLYQTLCDPMDDTIHGILQARIPEWVAFCFSRGSSQPLHCWYLALLVDSLPAESQGKPLLTKDEDYLKKEWHWHRGSMIHSIFLPLNLQLTKMSLPYTQGIWGISHNCAFKAGCTAGKAVIWVPLLCRPDLGRGSCQCWWQTLRELVAACNHAP